MKKNNKGSAFVMVLFILAIVGVLAAIALWVSLVNYQMKITDIKVKNNFYSAESVLDQICVGLQGDVSDAYKQAYDVVMINYSLLNEEEREGVFKTEYKKNLKQILKKGSDEMSYDLSRLLGYVYNKLLINDPSSPHVEIVAYLDPLTTSTEKGNMIVYESNILLKDIEVTFTDQDGFTSVIKTDISLDVPPLEMSASEQTPEVVAFSMVGNQGISFFGMETSVKGNVYAGNKGAQKDVSLTIASNVTFSDMNCLLSNGITKVNATKKLSLPESSDFWTNNIQIEDAATAVLQGNTIVADDLTLQGVSPKVYLGPRKSDLSSSGYAGGSYVGFGNSKVTASESSAIILNGRNSLLDMSSLRELLVGGYSYVNTSSMNVQNPDEKRNIAMGESITVKGNQVGYLIPPECICVNQDGVSLYNSNPITYKNYKDATDKKLNPNISEVDTKLVSPKLGKAIEKYFPEGTAPEKMFSRFFDPRNELVYYYINLSPEVATNYFFDYSSNADLGKIHLYTDYYADEIKFSESASLLCTAGNYTKYEDGKSTLRNEPSQDLESLLLGYTQKYDSLMRTLTTKPLTTEDLTKNNVFEYLIDETKLSDILIENGRDTVEVVYENESGVKYKAVLTSEEYDYDASKESDGTQVVLVISTKNVKLNKNFKGTVIAKGTIDVNADFIDKIDTDIMKQVLKKQVADKTAVFNVFREGEDYVIGTATTGDDTNSEKIAYSDIITYQNWTMK